MWEDSMSHAQPAVSRWNTSTHTHNMRSLFSEIFRDVETVMMKSAVSTNRFPGELRILSDKYNALLPGEAA